MKIWSLAFFTNRFNTSSFRALVEQRSSEFQLKIGLDCFTSFAKTVFFASFNTWLKFNKIQFFFSTFDISPKIKKNVVFANEVKQSRSELQFKIEFLIILLLPSLALSNQDYTQTLCEKPDYHCLSVQRGDSWLSLFPNESQRDIVRRVNRMNILLKPGMRLAIPNKLSNINVFDLAPFPRYVKSKGEAFIQINKQTLAWAAFNKEGEMLWWGPISPGIADCHDEKTGCLTPSGQFRLIRKKGLNCKSNTYPNFVDGSHGGAIMPFCMFFHKGYSLHGSYSLPGYPSSHGCILLFIEDAQWLNEQFVNVDEDGGRGTLVLIE